MWAFCCYWSQALVHGDLIERMNYFNLLISYWGLFCVLLQCQFWRRFYEVLRRRYILLFWVKYLQISVKSIWFITCVSFTVSLFSLFYWSVKWRKSGVEVSHYYVWGSLCVLSFSKVSFMMWVPLHLEHSWIETSFLWIFPLLSIKCPFLSLLNTFSWSLFYWILEWLLQLVSW